MGYVLSWETRAHNPEGRLNFSQSTQVKEQPYPIGTKPGYWFIILHDKRFGRRLPIIFTQSFADKVMFPPKVNLDQSKIQLPTLKSKHCTILTYSPPPLFELITASHIAREIDIERVVA